MGLLLCRRNSESSRSHMLIGISLCAPPLQIDGRQTHELSKTATLWLGDLCGAEAYDQVCTGVPAHACPSRPRSNA